ncbi:MAG: response regulator [Acidobacteria bacterium]|nr:response regulator [Acidobacteriota bacterium]
MDSRPAPEINDALGQMLPGGFFGPLFEAAFDLYGVVGAEGRVISMNGRIFEKAGSDPSLLAGQVISETVYWQSTENTSALLSTAVGEALAGSPRRLTLDFRLRVNESVPIELFLFPVSSSEEEAMVMVAGRHCGSGVQDEDGRHYAELIEAAGAAGAGLFAWDLERGRARSTPRTNEILGLSPYEELEYEAFISSIHPDDRPRIAAFIANAENQPGRFDQEFRVVYPDGKTQWIRAEGKIVGPSDTAGSRMLGNLRQITAEKVAAEELAKIYERERKAREEATEANRAKDFFLTLVSHELRAPLNAIMGWSKILLSKELDVETRRNALETIERSAQVQAKLINDLVDSARVASGKLRLEYRPTNLYKLIRGAVQAHQPAATSRELEFTFSADREDLVVFADANRLQQVFGNIISNAIKFTEPGGTVSIELTSDDGTAAIRIADTGQGINADALTAIFRQFSQGHVESGRNSSGFGLGLSIAKILAERHGGTITAESDGPGHGSAFTVRLPLKDAPATVALAESARPDARRLDGLRILIVEDDPDSREVLQLFLQQNGADIHAAMDARQAVEILNGANGRLPDLIISDLAMPGEDGLSLISRIRSRNSDGGAEIPAIALSAFTSEQSRDSALAAGFQRYATKPFDPEPLVGLILELTKQNGS